MSGAEGFKVSLKVLINKQRTKVLYAEAGSDFTDILSSFLTLPLGTIVRILRNHYGDEAPAIGSLTTLYSGLQNLDSDCFYTDSGKQMLLNPRKSFKNESECWNLKLNIDDTQPTKFFNCAVNNCITKTHAWENLGMYYDTCKCDCRTSALSDNIEYEYLKDDGTDDDGVYTKRRASFIISDDLQILPSETVHAIRILKSLGITDTCGTELMNVTFGFNEIMDLLTGSLLSPTPLTDLILSKRNLNSNTHANCETVTLAGEQIDKQSISKNKKMTLKAITQESTNIILYAEADGDFVDFLFSLLIIPLGAVENLLGGTSALTNIDNLYNSLHNIKDDKYLKIRDTRTMLLEPKLPTGYVSKSNILLLEEELLKVFLKGVLVTSFKSPKGLGNYVKEQQMYMVTDDLTVTPLCSTTSISIMNRLKIPLSDVKEVEVEIGLKEALCIVKASLTSTCALTDGLKIKPTLMKLPKQEHSGGRLICGGSSCNCLHC